MSTSSSPILGSQNSISDQDAAAEILRCHARRGWTPPPRISIPEWADRFRKLAKEAGSNSGQWRTSTVEVARGPMLAATEPGVQRLTAMVATQLLKSSLLENIVGYHIHLDPCPMGLVQPKEAAAQQFSKERVAPLIAATPVLRALVGETKTRDAGDTLDYKAFPGGFLAMIGAGSPDNLARRPLRIIMYDETDKYPPLVEGNALDIGDERLASFPNNSLSVRVCSPTLPDESEIEASYLESDQRRASVECPHCQHRQFLEFFDHVEWQSGKEGAPHRPETARVYCEHCHEGWSEGQRLRALQTIRWHQTRVFDCCDIRQDPLATYAELWRAEASDPVEQLWDWWAGERHAVYRVRCRVCGSWAVPNDHAGFQASKLYSPWGRDAPHEIARKYLRAGTNEGRKQVWWNTQMARTYRPNVGKAIGTDGLLARRENWPHKIVPDGVALLTVGIDTQDYWIEAEVVGWGRDEESWSIEHHRVDGEFSDPSVQRQLDEFLKRTWKRADGREFEIVAGCQDSGGHHTDAVYQFAKERLGRRIWAIKGESARTGERNPVWPTKRPTSRTKKSYRPVIIGVNAAKDFVRWALGREKPGAGYMHFNGDWDLNDFAQLTAERIEIKDIGGKKFRRWVLPDGRANERLDLRVYAYAALHGLMHMGLRLNRRADEVGAAPTLAIVTAEDQTPVVVQPKPPEPPVNVITVGAPPPEAAKKKSMGSLLARGGKS